MLRPLAHLFLVAALSCGLAGAAPETGGGPSLAWFAGKPLAQEVMKGTDYAWIKPGLNLNGHVLSIRDWSRSPSDSSSPRETAQVNRFSGRLREAVRRALGSAPGTLKVADEGDLHLLGRVVEVKTAGFLSKALWGFSDPTERAAWDIALVDGRSREVLAGFHHRVSTQTGPDAPTLDDLTQSWADAWARAFISAAWSAQPEPVAVAVAAAPPAAIPAPAPVPAQPAAEPAGAPIQELAADLERLDRLHRQGLLKDDEYQSLRDQAVRKASSRP